MVEASVAMQSSPDAEVAAREAAKSAMGRIRGEADLAIVFLSDRYRTKTCYSQALQAIQKQVGEQTPIIGCITPVIFASGELPTIRGAALMLLRSSDLKVVPLAYQNARVNARNIAKQMAKRYLPQINLSTAYAVIMFASGPIYPEGTYNSLEVTKSWLARRLTPIFSLIYGFATRRLVKKGLLRPTDYIDQLVETLGSKGIREVVGGNSFNWNALFAYEFFNTEIMNNSVVSCLLASDKLKFGIGWSYGATPTGRKMTIDKVLKGGLILGANKKGGQDALFESTGITKTYVEENLANQNYALLHHLQSVRDNTSGIYFPYISSVPPNLDSVVGSMPDRSLKPDNEIELLIQSGEDILGSVGACLREATTNIHRPKFAIIFECSNRAFALGDKIHREDGLIRETLGEDFPYIGFGGGGEFSYKAEGYHYVCSTIHALVAGE
ncbi:MAG: FIST N-terminal domain-containing protein [Candidatus Heimdallarchaeota archaeon]